MPLEILSLQGEEARLWGRTIERLPLERRDIHFLPEYARVFRDSYGYRPFLALYRDATGFVVQPFVRRPLGTLAFLADAADAGRFGDIANPYSYAGPVVSAVGPEDKRKLYREYALAFGGWSESEGIASEFGSLHPLFAVEQRSLVGDALPVKYIKDVVVISLQGSETEITEGLRKGHRSSIALARRSGVRVEKVVPSEASISAFRAMYEATMDRRQAAGRWYFPDGYFATIFKSLGPARATLLFAYVGNELESACLLMHDFTVAYYQFAATYAKHPAIGANNLLVWEAAMCAKRAGYQRLLLGGGVTSSPDDSLLRFKAGFSAQRAPLYTYFTVRNRAVYDELCARKREFERKTAGAESDSQFLPLYRR